MYDTLRLGSLVGHQSLVAKCISTLRCRPLFESLVARYDTFSDFNFITMVPNNFQVNLGR